MNTTRGTRTREAFTWLEVLVIVATLLLVLSMIPPMLGRARARAYRINCVSNLKQVGLAARIWSNDQTAKFPWEVSTNRGGTLEFAVTPDVFLHFEIMSNELASPLPLACPSDRERVRSKRFVPRLSNSNLSYFLGLEANEVLPQTILSGDRNLTGGVTNGSLRLFSSNNLPGWDARIHHFAGNLGLADGSVQQTTTQVLARQFQAALKSLTNTEVVRVVLPVVPGDRPPRSVPGWLNSTWIPFLAAGVLFTVLAAGWCWFRRRWLDGPSEPEQSS